MLLGIDIGGTSVKVGAVGDDGELLAAMSMGTPDLSEPDGWKTLTKLAANVANEAAGPGGGDSVRGIGIAVPGVVAPDGSTAMIPNARISLSPILAAFESSFPHARLTVTNDANAAAWGEYRRGGAREMRSFALVTLGTGIGCGIVLDGHLLTGAHGASGEIGHMKLFREGGEPCNCGGSGCLERYASAGALVANARKKAAALGLDADAKPYEDPRSIMEAHSHGDRAASEAVSAMCESLGLALSMLTCTMDPEVIFLGGGVANSADLFLDDLRHAYRIFSIPPCNSTPILPASLGNDAGMIGSALLAAQGES